MAIDADQKNKGGVVTAEQMPRSAAGAVRISGRMMTTTETKLATAAGRQRFAMESMKCAWLNLGGQTSRAASGVVWGMAAIMTLVMRHTLTFRRVLHHRALGERMMLLAVLHRCQATLTLPSVPPWRWLTWSTPSGLC